MMSKSQGINKTEQFKQKIICFKCKIAFKTVQELLFHTFDSHRIKCPGCKEKFLETMEYETHHNTCDPDAVGITCMHCQRSDTNIIVHSTCHHHCCLSCFLERLSTGQFICKECPQKGNEVRFIKLNDRSKVEETLESIKGSSFRKISSKLYIQDECVARATYVIQKRVNSESIRIIAEQLENLLKSNQCQSCGMTYLTQQELIVHKSQNCDANSDRRFSTDQREIDVSSQPSDFYSLPPPHGMDIVPLWGTDTILKPQAGNTNAIMYVCEICEQMYGTKENMLEHKAMHRSDINSIENQLRAELNSIRSQNTALQYQLSLQDQVSVQNQSNQQKLSQQQIDMGQLSQKLSSAEAQLKAKNDEIVRLKGQLESDLQSPKDTGEVGELKRQSELSALTIQALQAEVAALKKKLSQTQIQFQKEKLALLDTHGQMSVGDLLKCSTCNALFEAAIDLRQHQTKCCPQIKKKLSYVCQECGEVFPSAQLLGAHELAVHTEQETNKIEKEPNQSQKEEQLM